jgi:hypothetical protein
MSKGQFWVDLQEDLEDPEFRKHYEEAMHKITKEQEELNHDG